MKKLSKNAIIGYPAGIITGITYGLNPLFAVPLMKNGAATESILFFRYAFAVLLLGLFLLLRKQSFRVSGKQIGVLFVLGLLYTSSSIFLFDAFLYPVLVAIIMVFLKVVPSWPVWLAIAATFGGVLIMTQSDGSQTINPIGVLLSIASALVYALFIVIINRSKAIAGISNSLLTFYALMVGAIVFIGKILSSDTAITAGITTEADWLNLVGLALLPTIVSTATLAIASRSHQGFCTRRIRTHHRHHCRHTDVWRTADHQHHCRHFHCHGSRHVHDYRDQAITYIEQVKT